MHSYMYVQRGAYVDEKLLASRPALDVNMHLDCRFFTQLEGLSSPCCTQSCAETLQHLIAVDGMPELIQIIGVY